MNGKTNKTKQKSKQFEEVQIKTNQYHRQNNRKHHVYRVSNNMFTAMQSDLTQIKTLMQHTFIQTFQTQYQGYKQI